MIRALSGGFVGGVLCVILGTWLLVTGHAARSIIGGVGLITGGLIFACYSVFIYFVSVRRK